MSKDWYVWFRFFDAAKNKWILCKYKKGINKFKRYRDRLVEANALRQAIKESLEEGWNPIAPTVERALPVASITEAIDHVLRIKKTTLRKKSYYSYQYITEGFKVWLTKEGIAGMSPKYFTGERATEYMDQLLITKRYSGRTFNDHLIVLRTFFNCFVSRDWCSKNPFRMVKRQKQTIGRNHAYTEKEKEKLSNELYLNDRRLWFFTQIMYHCFIRRTELTTIRVSHVDLVNGTIIIPGDTAKNDTQESVVIPKDLEPVIKEMQLQNYPPDYFLFGRGLLTCDRQYKNPNWISTRHNDIVKRLGIDSQKGLYSWKHTGACAYYYLINKDIYSLMRQLRHREMNTTMIYLKSLGLIQNDAFKNASAA